MEKWVGKIAAVTGASAGIGRAISIALANAGVNVVGLARRPEKVQDIANELKSGAGTVHGRACDVADEVSVKSAFQWIEGTFGGVDILVNSAGIWRFISLLDDNENTSAELKRTMDVNYMGTVYCTREAYKSMNKRGTYGYIININSISGHYVPIPTPELASYNTYAASKYAITATTETLRHELTWSNNKKIRVASLSPGEVRTDLLLPAGYQGSLEDYYEANPPLLPENIAAGAIFMLSLPYNVQVNELTMRPVGEKY